MRLVKIVPCPEELSTFFSPLGDHFFPPSSIVQQGEGRRTLELYLLLCQSSPSFRVLLAPRWPHLATSSSATFLPGLTAAGGKMQWDQSGGFRCFFRKGRKNDMGCTFQVAPDLPQAGREGGKKSESLKEMQPAWGVICGLQSG